MKVGSQLKQVLTNTWHIPACGACHQTAKEMDQRTPQEIRDEVDIWAERLHQNAKAKKWTSLMGAAVRFVDGATHAVAGNALYRRLILDVCDYVEHSSKACVFRGERQGGAPWNKSIERFRCSCDDVEYKYCIVCVQSHNDIARASLDGVAICDGCAFNNIGETK